MSLDTFDSVFEQFPAVTPAEWMGKIKKDLKGEPFDKLIAHTHEGIDILPFYTKEQNEAYQLNIPSKTSDSCLITERIKVEDVLIANRQALDALQMGAGSVILNLQHQSLSQEQIRILVKDILLDIAPVYFENYTVENKPDLESRVKGSCPQVITIPVLDTFTDELVYALENGMRLASGLSCIHFYIGQNYFFEIAKLRAFRWLWKQVCDLNHQDFSVHIRCETSTRHFSTEDENGNILRNTTAAMSALLGGCDSLLINSHDVKNGDTPFGRRIARNIQHILQYESYLNELKDVARGSYYVEYLTYQLAEKAWKKWNNA